MFVLISKSGSEPRTLVNEMGQRSTLASPTAPKKVIAYLVVAMEPTLRPMERYVAAFLIDRFETRNGRCDSSISFMAYVLNVHERTVLRAVKGLSACVERSNGCKEPLFYKARHAGRSGRTSYFPNWPLFSKLHEAYKQRQDLFFKEVTLHVSETELLYPEDTTGVAEANDPQNQSSGEEEKASCLDEQDATVTTLSPDSRQYCPSNCLPCQTIKNGQIIPPIKPNTAPQVSKSTTGHYQVQQKLEKQHFRGSKNGREDRALRFMKRISQTF